MAGVTRRGATRILSRILAAGFMTKSVLAAGAAVWAAGAPHAASAEAFGPDGAPLHAENTLLSYAFRPAAAAAAHPTLALMLFERAATAGRSAAADAQADYATALEDGRVDNWRAHALWITDTGAFANARLVSIRRHVFTDKGGAHPFAYTASVLWDVERGRELAIEDLFVNGVIPKGLLRAWTVGLAGLKQERWGELQDITPYTSRGPALLSETAFSLTPSSLEGRAGGIVIHHAPYAVGSYAEGPYNVLAPSSAFIEALKPEYRTEFGGVPVWDPE